MPGWRLFERNRQGRGRTERRHPRAGSGLVGLTGGRFSRSSLMSMQRLTPGEVDRLILDSAVEANILPITSRCDCHCVFCSHKNNPPGIRAFSMGVRSLEEIARTMAFLDPKRPITIGESATPVIEGEPFSHPRFNDILSLLRRAYPQTAIEITTNGSRLTRVMAGFLKETTGVSLSVSLNSASLGGRGLLMGDSKEQAERTLAGVGLLGASDVPFSGSLVAMPNLVGWEDIRATVDFLAANGATVVRVVVPAYASRAKRDLFPEADRIHEEVREFVHGLPDDLPCPVLVEPSFVSDLTPVVSGVLRGSAAWEAGIRRGDVFVTVNGRQPRCRVEAWNLLSAAGDVVTEVRRDGRTETVSWVNPRANGADRVSGVTMEYDFDPMRMERLEEAIRGGEPASDRGGKAVLLTSELAYAVMRCVLDRLDLGRETAEPVPVENRTFGGSIRAAGLLTVDDYHEAYVAWRGGGPEPVRLIVPVESFDSRGVDLKGAHFSELERRTGVPVILR